MPAVLDGGLEMLDGTTGTGGRELDLGLRWTELLGVSGRETLLIPVDMLTLAGSARSAPGTLDFFRGAEPDVTRALARRSDAD